MAPVAIATQTTSEPQDPPTLKLHLKGARTAPRTRAVQQPSFTDPLEARKYAKERLAAAYRIFHKLGFDDAVSGHITLRDPIDPTCFWLASYGLPFDEVCASDLLLIDHNGNVLEGGRPGDGQLYNAAGFAIHGTLHAFRPDINAAAHAHSTYGKAFSALGRNIDIASHDAAAFSHTIKHYGTFGGVVLEDSEAERLCTCLGPEGKAIILQNHGLMSVGQTIEAAVAFYVRLEQLCESQLLVDSAGGPPSPARMDEGDERDVFGRYGGEEEAYFKALELFEEIEKETGGSYKE